MNKRKSAIWRGTLAGLLFLAGTASGTAAQDSAPPTGIEGIIFIGPIHGGPERPGETNSAPLANATFEVSNATGLVTSFTTDAAGHFHVPLAPGKYSVARKVRAKIGRCGPFQVEVTAAGFNQFRWQCDSGMR